MLVFLHVGRVLNRFSKDVGFLDDVLPFIFCEYLLVSVSYDQKFNTVHGFIVCKNHVFQIAYDATQRDLSFLNLVCAIVMYSCISL